jgi:hypothetical protein
MNCLGLLLADRDAASGAEEPDMRLRCPFRQGESPRFCRSLKFRTGRSIAPGRSKVWPSTWSPLAHTAGCTTVTRAAHGTAHCIRGCVRGVSGVCLTVSLPLSHRLRGCLIIRFLSGGRRDDRNYAISGVFLPIPSTQTFPVTRLLGHIESLTQLSGLEGPLPHHVPSPSPLLAGGMAARKRDRRQNFTPP